MVDPQLPEGIDQGKVTDIRLKARTTSFVTHGSPLPSEWISRLGSMSKKDVRPYFSYTRSQRRMKVKIAALSLACQQKYQDFNTMKARGTHSLPRQESLVRELHRTLTVVEGSEPPFPAG
jgi:hypothetical protein